jgi:hypothetical protein
LSEFEELELQFDNFHQQAVVAQVASAVVSSF